MRVMTLGVLACLLVAPALAQEEPPPEQQPAAAGESEPAAPLDTVPVPPAESAPAPAESTALDTIEVTAQRRVQRLVDVPVAVTALTQDQVEARRIGRLDDLNSLAPGLQVSRSPSNSTISQLTIRASSQINPAIYWDPAVGVYLDGVYIGKGQGSIFDIVDLSTVEVLRGPQGTLYGRNTIAGTINFITREPSGQFSGRGAVEFGNYGAQVYRASLDLPRLWIADITLGVRSERRDPWVETTPTSPVDGMNNRSNDGLHLGAVLDLYDGVEALYRYDMSETDQTNVFLQLFRYTGSNPPGMQDYVSRERRTTADINAPSGEFSDVEGHSLTLSWDISDLLSVKSISGMRNVKWVDKLDLDGSPNDVAHSERHTDYEQLSQDLQLSGHWGTWNYTAGAYYFEDDGYTVNPIYVELSGAPLDFDSQYGTHTKAWAAYGQADWSPLERLTVTLGARYTSEEKALDRIYGFRTCASSDALCQATVPYTYYMPEGTGFTAPGTYRPPAETFTDTTPTVAVAWRFTDWLNTYVRYAEGFKSGGFNGEFSNIQGTPQENQQETNTPFEPEKQKSLEVGAKSSLWNGRALVNLALFQNKLEDLQVSIFTASGAAASVIRNAGKATVQGVELESVLNLFQGTQLRANVAWLDPTYDEFIDAGQNEADNRAFVHAPELAWNVVLDSELWTTGLGTLRATLDYAWTDAFYTYPYQLAMPGDPNYNSNAQSAPFTEVPAYGLLNARLSFLGIPLGGTRSAELALFGRNVLDEDAPNNFIDFGPAFDNLTIANFVEPRAYGLAAMVRW